VPGLIRHSNQGVSLVVNNVRPAIRYILLILTILLLPIDGLAQRVLGAVVIFLRLQEPFVISLTGSVGLNLSAVATSLVVLFIIRLATGARHMAWRGLAITIIPYAPAVLVMMWLIIEHPGHAMPIDSTMAITASFITVIIASLIIRIDYVTLYLGLFIGSFIIDTVAVIMAGGIYPLGIFVIGYYGPIDGLVSVPLFGVLLASFLNPRNPQPQPSVLF